MGSQARQSHARTPHESNDESSALPVAERFVSINGEGRNAGRLAAFVRFVGCNLSCSYCDTRWACVPDCPHEAMDVAQICDWVGSTGAELVTLTGGEPLLQPRAATLLAALSAVPAVRQVEVETNGSIDLAPFVHQRDENACAAALPVSFTMDWKLPDSGMQDRMHEGNLAQLDHRDVVKFVASSRQDLDAMRAMCERHGLFERTNVFVGPVFGKIDPADVVAYLQEHSLVRATLQLQLHKLIWPGMDKGV